MRLAEFILLNVELILTEWDEFARSLAPAEKMTKLALRNDAESILRSVVADMKMGQTLAQQKSKSKGHGGASGDESDRLDDASSLHGVGRAGSGFDIVELVSEYRALRACVLRLWRESFPQPDLDDIDDITRFNESMDQSLAKAVGSYTQRVEQSRRMFLAILSHDLRNPLSCIRVATHLVSRKTADPDSANAVSMIETNTQAITRLINDLVDFASTGLGSAMPLTREPVDLVKLCREVFESFSSTHPDRGMRLEPRGDLTGHWDAARLRQVVSNLIGNALQHGSPDGLVELILASEGPMVVLSVRNAGTPIPPDMQSMIFNPLVRHATRESTSQRTSGSLGLGLYIVREIVLAHGGAVEVDSTAQEGTTFIVRLPRRIAD